MPSNELRSIAGEDWQFMEAPALCTYDEQMEIEAVLASQVIGLPNGVTAAAHISARRLVPLLTRHVTDHLGLHVYYGSRT